MLQSTEPGVIDPAAGQPPASCPWCDAARGPVGARPGRSLMCAEHLPLLLREAEAAARGDARAIYLPPGPRRSRAPPAVQPATKTMSRSATTGRMGCRV
jgi:hypothetical protein